MGDKVGKQLEPTNNEGTEVDERKKKGEKVGEQLQLAGKETDEENETKKKRWESNYNYR
jgi:hypothetical protein